MIPLESSNKQVRSISNLIGSNKVNAHFELKAEEYLVF